MEYTIQFPVGGLMLRVSAETVDELLEHYGKMGGDSSGLINAIMDTTANLHQDSAVRVTVEPARTPAVTPAPNETDTWSQEGPWADGPEKGQEPGKTDPWTREPVRDSRPAQRRSAPSGGSSAGSEQGASRDTDQYGRTWVRGLPDAPLCHCGLPTVRMDAKSGPNSKKPGTPYSKFRCDNRDSNCGYDEFPPKSR